ncbi:hypothetical protein E2562_024016 [Oryza meyeriana var. granulata]|uniref:Chromo domain-containing protein n=1 Tax=Oryza meyeriana var. granulata TaxID=110450 RepID=A0A6G1EAC4_9ORYZ|nr:hypothetical protein E2562_024016 [Oryza meyeriana var. granulata]
MEAFEDKKTVAEYEIGFNQIVRFVPHVAHDEVEKARQFRQGLKPAIRHWYSSDDGNASFYSHARAAYTSIPAATFRYSTGLAMQSIGEAIVYLRDTEHKIDLEPIRVEQDLTIECQSVRILDSSERVMRRRTIKYVKVLWTNQSEREATWELEEEMCKKCPELFETVCH